MEQTMTVPVWFFVAFCITWIIVFILDGWRARMWRKYIEAVNKYVEKTQELQEEKEKK